MNKLSALWSFVVLGCLSAFASSCWAQCSPIVVDLGKDGIQLGQPGVGVHFDVNADRIVDHVQWVRPGGDEAFLARDMNGNGVVDDGGELFGMGTAMELESGYSPNGFVGLAQFDLPALGGNDDGLITAADAVWDDLSLWRDANADGVSEPSEMLTPEQLGLTSFETIPKERRHWDEAGNTIPYWAWATSSSRPTKMLMVDVFFRMLPEQVAANL